MTTDTPNNATTTKNVRSYIYLWVDTYVLCIVLNIFIGIDEIIPDCLYALVYIVHTYNCLCSAFFISSFKFYVFLREIQ